MCHVAYMEAPATRAATSIYCVVECIEHMRPWVQGTTCAIGYNRVQL